LEGKVFLRKYLVEKKSPYHVMYLTKRKNIKDEWRKGEVPRGVFLKDMVLGV
jgi:hypothetical protein